MSGTLDQRSQELDKKMEDNPIDESIDVLVRDAKRRRRQIFWLTISLMLDVLLTIGFGFLSVQTYNAATTAQHSQNAIVASCEAGNEFRVTEAALWNHILNLQPVITNLTPEQQAQRDKTVAEFREYLKTTFAPRDCSNIIKK
jgi:hypothetical protein